MVAIINKTLCRGCARCMVVCPEDAITLKLGKAEVEPSECIGCGVCVDECPCEAINMRDRKDL